MALVDQLRKEKHWLLEKVSRDEIRLARTINGRPVTIRLLKIGDKYRVVFPSYIFQSRISHFAPMEEELRNCRNRAILISLIKLLRRSAIWEYVINQDFMTVNRYNEKSNKRKLRKELRELIDEE